MKKELFLVLHNIRSAYNVGAILRTADGAGVTKVYFSGFTPTPAKKEKTYKTKAEKMLEKTALGAEESVSWEKIENQDKLIKEFKEKGVVVVSLENVSGSVDLKKFIPKFPLVLFMGSEVEGISKEILNQSDKIISIPMRGKKESLNVSVAAGIAIYEILK